MSKWRFDGVPFFGSGAYLTTQFDDADELPALRGDNAVIPHMDGRLDVDQLYDQRKINMGLYSSAASLAGLESSHDALRQLLGVAKPRKLERIMADGSIREAWAKPMNLQVKRVSPLAMKLTVDFVLASPYFRATAKTTVTETVGSSPINFTLTNPGTAEDRTALITLTGPMTNPKLINTLQDPVTGGTKTVWLGYTGVIGDGENVYINVAALTCYNSSIVNLLNLLSHGGDDAFLVLMPGANALTVQASGLGGGVGGINSAVKIEFYAPYF